MKIKKPFIAYVAVTIAAIFVYSCRKEFSSTETISPKVEWAKTYFTQTLLPDEGNIIDPRAYIQNSAQASRMSKYKENIKIPIWQKAMEAKTPLYDLVEIPLKYTTKVTPMLYINPGDNFQPAADREVLKASFDRLVVYKNKKGQIDQRIVSFIPSKTYLNRHNGDISHNRVTKLDVDFDGVLVYKKWNGQFLYAIYIKDGKSIKKLVLQKSKMQLQKTAYLEPNCETVYLYEWFQICYYEGDSQVPFMCDPPYSELIDTFETCEENPCDDPLNAYLVECGGVGEENCEATESSIVGEPTSVNIGTEDVVVTSTTREKKYKWRYLDNLFWSYISVEKGVQKKVGSEWHWDTLNHVRVYQDGIVVGGTLTMTINSAVPTIGIYNAGMTLNYDFNGNAVCKGSPVSYSRPDVTQNSPLWNVDDF